MEILPIPAPSSGRAEVISGQNAIESLMEDLLRCGKLIFLDSSLGFSGAKYRREEGRHLGCNGEGKEGQEQEKEKIGLLGPVPLPVSVGKRSGQFSWYVFSRVQNLARPLASAGGSVNSIITLGNIRNKTPLVRLHSACHTGDILGSMRCDCGPQLREALRRIAENRCGVLAYISNHEGRGIGLWGKALAYILQDKGYDTYEANTALGFPQDARNYGDSLLVLRYLLGGKNRKIKLLSNNPEKKRELLSCGFNVEEMVSLVAGVNPSNLRYLEAKMRHGHNISADDLRYR